MNIPNINITDYTYDLPDNRIAKYPLKNRDASKLLIYKNSEISQAVFSDLPEIIPHNSLLVFNNSKVIRARLKFQKETGATIEIFCLEPIVPADVQQAFETTKTTQWKCIIGNAKRWKTGVLSQEIDIKGNKTTVSVEKKKQNGQSYIIEFSWDSKKLSFADIIQNIGTVPIPPYLNRKSESVDDKRYQTVYSKHKGSVAAPTAGLHFTNGLLNKLQQEKTSILNITLHVGAGTFKPVQSKTIADHDMHTEHFVVEYDALEEILQKRDRVIAVGTTTVRTLESLYWLGVKLLDGADISEGIHQWDPYNLPDNYSVEETLTALKDYMKKNKLSYFNSKTAIIIVPGYNFKIVKTLITNFHQPKSTLLLLIGAFIGETWRDVYNYASENDFRFLSYGDSSILFGND